MVGLWAWVLSYSLPYFLHFICFSNSAFHNLRPSGADYLHPSGWSEVFGCNGGSSDIFGIPKDNLATPQDRGLAASTVIDGFRWCRLLFSSPSCRDITSLSNAQNHRHIVRCDGERYSPTIPTYSFCPHRFCRRTCRASCVICR